MILDGQDVQVTDVDSGEDITAKVLAQIILEHDPGKLGAFPAELLHRVIRANEPLIRDFIERYFNQFLRAYMESQRDFDRYLRQAMGLEFPVSAAGDWFRTMMWPLGACRRGRSAAGGRFAAAGATLRRRRHHRRVGAVAGPGRGAADPGAAAAAGRASHQDQEEGVIVRLHNDHRVQAVQWRILRGYAVIIPHATPGSVLCVCTRDLTLSASVIKCWQSKSHPQSLSILSGAKS